MCTLENGLAVRNVSSFSELGVFNFVEPSLTIFGMFSLIKKKLV